MTGYLGDPRAQRRGHGGGYYHTGDVASRDADGYITYIGRTDDVFKSADYKVSPFELESVLIEHPAVAEAAVVPAPDPMRGSRCPRPTSPSPPGTSQRGRPHVDPRHAREHLAPYPAGAPVEFASCRRRSPGKIRRVELRTREEELFPTGGSPTEFSDADFPELRS